MGFSGFEEVCTMYVSTFKRSFLPTCENVVECRLYIGWIQGGCFNEGELIGLCERFRFFGRNSPQVTEVRLVANQHDHDIWKKMYILNISFYEEDSIYDVQKQKSSSQKNGHPFFIYNYIYSKHQFVCINVSFIPYFRILVFGILVTLVFLSGFFRLAHLALQNVNKDCIIFLLFS